MADGCHDSDAPAGVAQGECENCAAIAALPDAAAAYERWRTALLETLRSNSNYKDLVKAGLPGEDIELVFLAAGVSREFAELTNELRSDVTLGQEGARQLGALAREQRRLSRLYMDSGRVSRPADRDKIHEVAEKLAAMADDTEAYLRAASRGAAASADRLARRGRGRPRAEVRRTLVRYLRRLIRRSVPRARRTEAHGLAAELVSEVMGGPMSAELYAYFVYRR